MKKLILSLVLLSFFKLCSSQMIYTPDSMFRTKLIDLGYESVIVGDSINSSDSIVLNTLTLHVGNSNISSLEGISAFSNLQHLYCEDNNLISLPSLPLSLLELACFNNQLTLLPSLPTGILILQCSNNQLTSLPDFSLVMNYLDCSNNLLTTLPEIPESLTYIVCSNNLLTSIPDLPINMWDGGLYCSNNPTLNCLPKITNIWELIFTNCNISCLPNRGNVRYSNPSIDSLPLCSVFNSNGCTYFYYIKGQTYLDIDGSCTQSFGDSMLQNLHINLFKDGNLVQQTFSLNDGSYNFTINGIDTGNYEVRLDTNGIPFTLLCPSSANYLDTINTTDSLFHHNDFALQCKSNINLSVWSIIGSTYKPGHISIITINIGDISNFYNCHCLNNIPLTVIVNVFDSLHVTHYAGPVPGSIYPTTVDTSTTWGMLKYSIPNISEFNSSISFFVKVDSNAIVGMKAFVNAIISGTPIGRELISIVKGSYDPNEKTVYPRGVVDTSEQWLTYTVQFQNTGTDTANLIKIVDTLDVSIDLLSFTFVFSSLPNLELNVNNNILQFVFNTANLPDSNTNEPYSHGFIQYKVKIKRGLPLGTEILNTAYIYFDYNSPIATNTTHNLIDLPDGIKIIQTEKQLIFNVYPVPFTDNLTIEGNYLTNKLHFTIFDICGKTIMDDRMTDGEKFISTIDWMPGVYFLRIETNNTMVVKKLIKN